MSDGARASSRRRWRIVIGVVVVVALVVGVEAVPVVPGHRQAVLMEDLAVSDASAAVTRALPFLDRLPTQECAGLEAEYEVGNHLLQGNRIGWYATVWSSYQALGALYTASLISDRRSCTDDFEQNLRAINNQYWDASYVGSPAAFDQGPHALHFHSDLPRVDDSLWMGLAEMRGYLITRDPALLRRAQAVFALAVGNWDPVKGGVYWEYHTAAARIYDKSVVSNAPAVVLGAGLYAATGRSTYLTWSGRILQWLEDNLVDPRTGLYGDHVDDNGGRSVLDAVDFTYNQGIMVGALAAMAKVDPARYSLSDAVDLARRSIAQFRSHHTYGQPAFDAIWAENLLWTVSLSRDADLAREARSSIGLAIRAEPRAAGSLLAAGSEATLHSLAQLPARDYPELSYIESGGR